jgi:Cof subfamily protein (haloacid dehalogenase superfamily)
MHMIKLVLTDMDNTLLPFGCERVSPRALDAIRELRAAGVEFGPATGRDAQELLRFFGGSDSAFQTGILSNGKKVYLDGQLKHVSYIDNAALQRLADYVGGYEGCFVTAYPFKTDASNPAWCIGATAEEVAPYARDFRFAPTLADAVPEDKLIAATVACPLGQDVLEKIKARGMELCPEFDIVQPVARWCDVVPHGLNKGTALPLLLDSMGITPDEVLFFGDAENDLAIMRVVPNSVAVANATPAAAAAARYHIGRCDEDSVAAALEELACATREGRTPRFMLEG